MSACTSARPLIGVEFTGDLKYTRDGCTATYRVAALSPAVECGDDNGKPDVSHCNVDNGVSSDPRRGLRSGASSTVRAQERPAVLVVRRAPERAEARQWYVDASITASSISTSSGRSRRSPCTSRDPCRQAEGSAVASTPLRDGSWCLWDWR